jgi:outer membrane protein assembly factor BamB
MRRTTICCSALALIAAWSLLGSAQTTVPTSLRRVKQTHPDDRAPLSLFPLKTLWTLALNSAIAAPPAYDATRGFFPIGDQIVAYNLISGTRLWVVAASTRVEPATGDDLVFVVEPAAVAALRASDGSRAWELPFADTVAVPPAWDNGWLVVASAEGQVMTLRATDGEILWRRDLGAPLHGRPAFAGDRVYLPMSDSRAIALRIETGAPVWERRLGGAANDITALDDRIYLGSQDKYMYCLNAEDGEVEWRWLTGGPVIGQPVVDERTVYFVSLDNVLRALNRSSGVQRWKRALPVRPVSGPLEAIDALVVTGVSPVLRGYRLEDGKPAGELAIAGDVVAPPRLFTTPSRSLPILIAVTHDRVKGSTVVALTRSVEPAVTVIAPLPNLIVMTPQPTTPPPVRP